MQRIQKHFERSFQQPVTHVLHPTNENIFHLDVLCFEPTELYPFWKLATMGASDIVMPQKDVYGCNRNEYVMFIDKEVDFTNDFIWYVNWLYLTAEYILNERKFVTVNHVLQVSNPPEGEMDGLIVLLPAAMYDGTILHCKTGLFKECTCLQIMPITQAEIDGAQVNGFEWLVSKFYPFIYGNDEQQDDEEHYCAEKIRTF